MGVWAGRLAQQYRQEMMRMSTKMLVVDHWQKEWENSTCIFGAGQTVWMQEIKDKEEAKVHPRLLRRWLGRWWCHLLKQVVQITGLILHILCARAYLRHPSCQHQWTLTVFSPASSDTVGRFSSLKLRSLSVPKTPHSLQVYSYSSSLHLRVPYPRALSSVLCYFLQHTLPW